MSTNRIIRTWNLAFGAIPHKSFHSTKNIHASEHWPYLLFGLCVLDSLRTLIHICFSCPAC